MVKKKNEKKCKDLLYPYIYIKFKFSMHDEILVDDVV